MGKNRRHGGGRGRGRGHGRDRGGERGDERRHYEKAESVENTKFVEYYKTQGIIPEKEWDQFLDVMRTPLPVVFRINGTTKFALHIRDGMKKDYVDHMKGVEIDGEVVEPPRPLAWYADELAWQFCSSRKQVRKNPVFNEFHKFLVNANEEGHLTRQEAVSMIPPLLLHVEPQHKVLDMCAAPGQKTAQILERLHSSTPEGVDPEGLVIANDSNWKRCHLLTHQTQRLGSANILVVNRQAEHFPIHLKPFYKRSEDAPKGLAFDSTLQFDRVLCDVPCSGDGTLRKAPDIWGKWHANNGLVLHRTQSKIFKRGVKLVKQDGIIVYSTCSLNPVENEAVVADVLRTYKGTLELVDCSDELPAFIRRPGITSWKVMDKEGRWFSCFEEVPPKSLVRASHFPPTEEESGWMHLELCMRIYPHDQDTGGFFVSVFRKTGQWPSQEKGKNKQKEEEMEREEEEEEEGGDETLKESIAGDATTGATFEKYPNAEAPYLPVSDNTFFETVIDFYGLTASFPREQLMSRSEGEREKLNKVYYVSKPVRHVLELDIQGKLRTVATGLKAFQRIEKGGDCNYRVCQEGLPSILPFMTKRVVRLSLKPMRELLSRKSMPVGEFAEPARTELMEMKMGCSAVVYTPAAGELEFAQTVCLSAWRGRNTLNLFVAKTEIGHLRQMFGVTDIREEKWGDREDLPALGVEASSSGKRPSENEEGTVLKKTKTEKEKGWHCAPRTHLMCIDGRIPITEVASGRREERNKRKEKLKRKKETKSPEKGQDEIQEKRKRKRKAE